MKPSRCAMSRRMQTDIDNGGRFYNLFSQANDQVLTRGELAKAAGVFTAGVNAFLFFEMAQQELQPDDRQAVLHLLDSDLRKNYQRYLETVFYTKL